MDSYTVVLIQFAAIIFAVAVLAFITFLATVAWYWLFYRVVAWVYKKWQL